MQIHSGSHLLKLQIPRKTVTDKLTVYVILVKPFSLIKH